MILRIYRSSLSAKAPAFTVFLCLDLTWLVRELQWFELAAVPTIAEVSALGGCLLADHPALLGYRLPSHVTVCTYGIWRDRVSTFLGSYVLLFHLLLSHFPLYDFLKSAAQNLSPSTFLTAAGSWLNSTYLRFAFHKCSSGFSGNRCS